MPTPVGAYANRSAVPEPLQGTSGAAHVRALAELPYGIVVGEVADQLHLPAVNRTTVIPSGSGASYFAIEYMDISRSSNGKLLFVVFNAASNAEADSMLGTPGQRYVIPIDGWRSWAFEFEEPLLRIDFCSDAATESAGASKVTWEYGLL
jgi:hypothetical protein